MYILWHGDEDNIPPTDPNSIVEITTRQGKTFPSQIAGDWSWTHKKGCLGYCRIPCNKEI